MNKGLSIFIALALSAAIHLTGAQAQQPAQLPDTRPSVSERVLPVRGGTDRNDLNFEDILIPGGEYQMGDHFGFVDPQHPSDEIPIHTVRVDSFYMAKTELTNQQFTAFLNAKFLEGAIGVRNHIVYRTGDTTALYFTHEYEPWYSIAFDGTAFAIADFRAAHPVTGVMWTGAALFCNWFSHQNGLQPCYDSVSWACNFTVSGFRLPTEAEWEYAARGGYLNPYFNYPNGNSVVNNQANLPASGDPYETGPYPNTTPVAFFDGTLKTKAEFNWPGSATTYQTSDGANGYGLYDMQGNVWELLNDWYGQNYYSVSPYDNPKGPSTGFIMPDGKPYRGMRGGNWYNGYTLNGVNDGHSRVSNRNPSYYRGPQDPNHPWYHVGFRTARNTSGALGLSRGDTQERGAGLRLKNHPNPCSDITTVRYYLESASEVNAVILDYRGMPAASFAHKKESPGWHSLDWRPAGLPGGIYYCRLTTESSSSTVKIIVIKP